MRPLGQLRAWWPDSSTGPGFESGQGCEIRSSEYRHVCYRINILGSQQLSPSSINLVPVQAATVTVVLASHWPCVTGNSGLVVLPPCGTGIRELMRGMATLPQGNQELLLVSDKVGRPQVSLE